MDGEGAEEEAEMNVSSSSKADNETVNDDVRVRETERGPSLVLRSPQNATNLHEICPKIGRICG